MYLACNPGILRSDSSGEDLFDFSPGTAFILSSNGKFAFTGLETHPDITGEAYFVGGNNLFLTKNFGDSFLMNKIPNNSLAGYLTYHQEQDLIIICTNSGIWGFRIMRQ
jgi:hypothetical protein